MQISDHENPLVRRTSRPAFEMSGRAPMGLYSLACSLIILGVVLAMLLLAGPAHSAPLRSHSWKLFSAREIARAYAHVPTPWWLAR